MEARTRCWIHEDCLMDVELARACGPNVIDMPMVDETEDNNDGSYGNGFDGFGDGDGYGTPDPTGSGYGDGECGDGGGDGGAD